MKYIVLLRGVNVGGKRKVTMADLKSQLTQASFTDVTSYINSGNILLTSNDDRQETIAKIAAVLKAHYDFEIPFVALNIPDFQAEYESLPTWWFSKDNFRRNVLFYLPGYDANAFPFVANEIERMQHGKLAIYWTVKEAEFYSRSQYQKLVKSSVYSFVTIRNANTLKKLYELSKSD